MNGFRLAAAISVAFFVAGPIAQAHPARVAASDIDPAKLDAARKIVAIVLPPDQREHMMGVMLDATMSSMVAGAVQANGMEQALQDNPKLREIFERFVARQRELAMADIRDAMPGLVEAYAHAYARNFSADELKAVLAFVQTPAGAHFVQRGPTLLTDPDVSAWQRKLAAASAERQERELLRLKEELIEAGKDPASGA